MNRLLFAVLLIASFPGCSSRPTLDRLTYYEATILLEAEIERGRLIRAAADETPAYEVDWKRQMEQVERIKQLRKAAWERESKDLP